MSENNIQLKWKSYLEDMRSLFLQLRQSGDLTDILITNGHKSIKCHRVILSSACRSFYDLMKEHSGDLVIYLGSVNSGDMTSLVDFMYTGVVDVPRGRLASFLSLARQWGIRGLDEDQTPTGVQAAAGVSSRPGPPAPATTPSCRQRQADDSRPAAGAGPPQHDSSDSSSDEENVPHLPAIANAVLSMLKPSKKNKGTDAAPAGSSSTPKPAGKSHKVDLSLAKLPDMFACPHCPRIFIKPHYFRTHKAKEHGDTTSISRNRVVLEHGETSTDAPALASGSLALRLPLLAKSKHKKSRCDVTAAPAVESVVQMSIVDGGSSEPAVVSVPIPEDDAVRRPPAATAARRDAEESYRAADDVADRHRAEDQTDRRRTGGKTDRYVTVYKTDQYRTGDSLSDRHRAGYSVSDRHRVGYSVSDHHRTGDSVSDHHRGEDSTANRHTPTHSSKESPRDQRRGDPPHQRSSPAARSLKPSQPTSRSPAADSRSETPRQSPQSTRIVFDDDGLASTRPLHDSTALQPATTFSRIVLDDKGRASAKPRHDSTALQPATTFSRIVVDDKGLPRPAPSWSDTSQEDRKPIGVVTHLAHAPTAERQDHSHRSGGKRQCDGEQADQAKRWRGSGSDAGGQTGGWENASDNGQSTQLDGGGSMFWDQKGACSGDRGRGRGSSRAGRFPRLPRGRGKRPQGSGKGKGRGSSPDGVVRGGSANNRRGGRGKRRGKVWVRDEFRDFTYQ